MGVGVGMDGYSRMNSDLGKVGSFLLDKEVESLALMPSAYVVTHTTTRMPYQGSDHSVVSFDLLSSLGSLGVDLLFWTNYGIWTYAIWG